MEQLNQQCQEINQEIEKLEKNNGSGEFDNQIILSKGHMSAYQYRIQILNGEMAISDPEYTSLSVKITEKKMRFKTFQMILMVFKILSLLIKKG